MLTGLVSQQPPLELYRVLGLASTGVDGATIKRQYHRLSLRYHPDRSSDPAATEAFQTLQAAYAVLSNPRRRRIYDAYGPAGLQLFETFASSLMRERELHDGGNADAEAGEEPPPLDQVLCAACTVGAVGVLAVCAYLLLLSARVDGHVRVAWTALLLPLWLYHGAVLARGGGGADAAQPTADAEAKRRAGTGERHGRVVLRWLLAASHLVLSLRLDAQQLATTSSAAAAHGLAALPWAAACAPLWLWEAAQLARALLAARASSALAGAARPAALLCACNVCVACCARLAFEVLIVLRADATVRFAWPLVTLPLWLSCAVLLAANAASGRQCEATHEVARAAAAGCVAGCLACALLALALCLRSALPVVAPALALGACYTCCCGCWSVTFLSALAPAPRAVPGPLGLEAVRACAAAARENGGAASDLPAARMPRSAGGTPSDSLLVSQVDT